jgi:hypothetical protein
MPPRICRTSGRASQQRRATPSAECFRRVGRRTQVSNSTTSMRDYLTSSATLLTNSRLSKRRRSLVHPSMGTALIPTLTWGRRIAPAETVSDRCGRRMQFQHGCRESASVIECDVPGRGWGKANHCPFLPHQGIWPSLLLTLSFKFMEP